MIARIFRIVGKTLLALIALVLLLVFGAAVALQTPWAKQRIATGVEELLNAEFMGHFDVGLVQARVGLAGVASLDVTVRESDDGAALATLNDVEAGWMLGPLLASLLQQSLRIELPKIVARRGFVDLSAPEKLADAFAARNPSPSTDTEVVEASPSVFVDLGDIELHDVTVRVPGQDGSMDVVVSRVDAELWVGEYVLIHAAVTDASATTPYGPVELTATGLLVVDAEGELTAVASANAHAGDARLDALGSLTGDDFRVVGSADATAAGVRDLDVGWVPTGETLVEYQLVSLNGSVEVAAATLVGGSALDASASVNLEPLQLQGAFSGRRLSPADYHAAAAAGHVDLDGRLALDSRAGVLLLELRNGRYAGETIPPISLVAREKEWREFAVEAHTHDASRATVGATLVLGEEPKMSLRATSEARRGVPGSALDVNLGKTVIDAEVTFDAEFDPRQASLQLDVDALALPGSGLAVRAMRGQVEFAHSDAAGLSGHGRLSASSVLVAGKRIRKVNVRAAPRAGGIQANVSGEVRHEDKWLPVDAAGLVKQQPSLEVSELRVAIHDEPKPIRVRAKRVYPAPNGDWVLEGGRLSGAGELHIDGAFGEHHRVALTLDRLDLERLANLAIGDSPVSGSVSGSANLEFRPIDSRVKGELALSAADLQAAGHTLPFAEVELRGDGGLLNGRAHAEWADSTVQLTATEVDVESLRYMVITGGGARLADFVGQIAVEVRATEDGLQTFLPDSDLPPGSALDVELTLKHTGGEPLQLTTDVVASVDVASDLPAGDPAGTATIHLLSEYSETNPAWQHSLHLDALNGGLADMHIDVALPLATIPFHEWMDRISEAELEGQVRVTHGDLALLPRDLPLPGLKGSLSGYATIHGPIDRPVVAGGLRVRRFQVQSIESSLPVDIELEGRFGDGAIVGDVEVVHEGSLVASAEGTVDVKANTAVVGARLENFSVGCFPYLRDYGVEGHLSGFASLTAGEQKRVSVYLAGRGFKVYGDSMPFFSVAGTLEGATAEGRLQVTQLDGKLDTRWVVQASDDGWQKVRSVHLKSALQDFELRPLLVVARGPIADLAGKVNGSMDVELANQEIHATGKLRLTQGSVLVPVLGRDIREVELDLLARPGRIDIEGVKARFGRGRFSGGGNLAYAANGRLGLSVDLNVPEGDAIPILSEGREIAELAGRVTLKGASDEAGAWNSTIDLNRLRININEDGNSEVGSLESPDYVQVGHRGIDGKFKPYEQPVQEAPPGTQAKPMRLRVNLGKDVWVYRGRSTFAALEGALNLELSQDVHIEGGLQVPEGRIDVMGRVFEVQPSTVTFGGGAPPDPEVVAEASWRSPSGHVIIASYRGPATSGKMQLRSEPPLSYGEILNVLLFDDPTGAGESQGAASASSMAGTLAGAGLGKTLSNLTNLNIQTTVQTTESGSSKPEVGIRLSPRLAFQVSYNPQPILSITEPPDQATVSLDWRISKRWSLDTSLGDQGSASADLAWEFRY